MSHILGKVYDLTQENFQMVINELDVTRSVVSKMAIEIVKLREQLGIAKEALDYLRLKPVVNDFKYPREYYHHLYAEYLKACGLKIEQALSGIKTIETGDIVPDRVENKDTV